MTASTTQGRDPASLRRHNLRTLLRHLHLQGPTSRAELGEVTGLTRSAIADLVGELTTRGLVLEEGAGQPHTQRGRPPLIVSPRDESAYVLAVVVDVDTIGIGRVGLGGTILEEAETQHEHVSGDPTRSLDQLTGLVQEWLESTETSPVAIGVAVPGIVRARDGLIARAPNLGWRNLSLGDELRHRTGLSLPIVIGNEAGLAALAEHRRGAGREYSDLVYVSAGVGLGGGIITGDRLLTGHTGYGGEVGHMITHPGGRYCHCGGRGCWETEVGADALLRHAGVHDPADRHAALDALFVGADQAETPALEAFRALCTPVATGLANLINIFEPERIILGGLLRSLIRHAGDELRTALDDLRGLPELDVDLQPAQLGEHGRLLGAAEAAVNSFLARLD
ncbi:ROK family protein [Haloactinomyces albus]|uniref:NBD/HSP70 family sugar kinase/biotin operon repressor n=1 Tax=Haloactinomyces albus TaxID=1352928 RepID=A0AAE3ZFZ0_9ACTN|nr:ROK family protein [Haloactinomyces albus]MDR7302873.1 putative NBD/HSP70 family sugar kinase/biotin operon repressor [Haloactinomyces albus]